MPQTVKNLTTKLKEAASNLKKYQKSVPNAIREFDSILTGTP
jgi:hypothetical protein